MPKNLPLICNQNSLHHIDYGIPIVCNKSTDYRTRYNTSHGLIPDISLNLDVREKLNLRPDLQYRNVKYKQLSFETTSQDYTLKHMRNRICENYGRASSKMQYYTRTVQEKIFTAPPMPLKSRISEMKENYRINYYNPNVGEVLPPALTAICPIQGLGRDEQPPVRPEEKGSWKWMDPYLTTQRSQFVLYNKDQSKMAKKDIPTLYNTSGKWPGFDEPLPPRNGNKCVYDTRIIKYQHPNRNLPKITKAVPNFGSSSEYMSQFHNISKSDLLPYINTSMQEFGESLSESSAWQNLAPPGMYCTEYCQIGTKQSSRNIINVDKPKKEIVHSPCR